MPTLPRTITPLRMCLALLFALLLLLQTVSLPGQFAHMAAEHPASAPLRWPLTALTVFWVLCAQVVVVATWQLLSLVGAQRIFSDAAFRWVDVIVWAVAAAWATLVGLLLYVGLRADDPAPIIVLGLITLGVSVLGLLMTVMRALLRQATILQAVMETVI